MTVEQPSLPTTPPTSGDTAENLSHLDTKGGRTAVSAQFLKIFGVFFIAIILIVSAVGYFKTRLQDVSQNYEQCTKRAGSRIQESYPATCITVEGNYFIQPITDQDGNPIMTPPMGSMTNIPGTTTVVSPSPVPNGYVHTTMLTCKRVGCSGELCVDINSEDVVSDCSYKAEYSCYQEAPCERQTAGNCGFTPSAGLTACLENIIQ